LQYLLAIRLQWRAVLQRRNLERLRHRHLHLVVEQVIPAALAVYAPLHRGIG
jgi:hypothetical protein